MTDKTTKERLAIIETKLGAQMQWIKGIIVGTLASVGINLANFNIT